MIFQLDSRDYFVERLVVQRIKLHTVEHLTRYKQQSVVVQAAQLCPRRWLLTFFAFYRHVDAAEQLQLSHTGEPGGALEVKNNVRFHLTVPHVRCKRIL